MISGLFLGWCLLFVGSLRQKRENCYQNIGYFQFFPWYLLHIDISNIVEYLLNTPIFIDW